MDEARLVCLYRCRECGARLFEKDAPSHAERHGFCTAEWRQHFIRGKRDTWSRPGMHHKPLNHGRTKKKNISFGQGEKERRPRNKVKAVRKVVAKPSPPVTAPKVVATKPKPPPSDHPQLSLF